MQVFSGRNGVAVLMAARGSWITAALKQPLRPNAAGAPGVLIHCVMCDFQHRLIAGAIPDEGRE